MSDVIELENIPTEITSPTGEDAILANDDSQPSGSILKTGLIKLKNMFVNGLYLSSRRKFAEEKTTEGLSADGWYDIAILADVSFARGSADFTVSVYGSDRNGSMRCSVNFSGSSGAKYLAGGKIVIKDWASYAASESVAFPFIGVTGLRLAKSDSVNSAGAKLQAQIDVSTTASIDVQMTDNYGHLGNDLGWVLCDATLVSGADYLPDGITTATYLEAGAEYSIGGEITGFKQTGITAIKTSDNNVRIYVPWVEKPKKGSTIDFVFDGSTCSVSGGGAVVTIDDTFVEAEPWLIGNNGVVFNYTKSGAFAALPSNTICYVSHTGSINAKLVIGD